MIVRLSHAIYCTRKSFSEGAEALDGSGAPRMCAGSGPSGNANTDRFVAADLIPWNAVTSGLHTMKMTTSTNTAIINPATTNRIPESRFISQFRLHHAPRHLSRSDVDGNRCRFQAVAGDLQCYVTCSVAVRF